jgi:DNA-binding transcriptional MerR regulator
MLTKQNICEATGIAPTTFHHWQKQGLIPPPAGRKNRAVTWPESIIGRVDLILDLQGRGQSLEEIKTFLGHMDLHAEEDRQRALFDDEHAKSVVEAVVSEVFNFTPVETSVFVRQLFTEETAPKYYAVAAGTDKVVVIVIDSETRSLDASRLLSPSEYVEIVAAMTRICFEHGRIADPTTLPICLSLIPEWWDEALKEAEWRIRLMEVAKNNPFAKD